MNNARITAQQCMKLLFLFALGSAALLLPSMAGVYSGQDLWVTMLLAWPLVAVLLVIYNQLLQRFPTMTLQEYVERIVGKWVGIIISLSYLFFFIMLSALIVHNISDFLRTSILLQTPAWFIDVTFILIVVYGVALGIETLARTGEILFVWTLFTIIAVAIFLLNKIDLQQLLPIMYEGIARPIKGLYPVIGFPICEFVFLVFVLPLVRKEDRKKLGKYLQYSGILVIAISVLLSVLLVSVMGAEEMIRSPYAIYDMAKYIDVQQILVRVEVLAAMIWIGTIFIKLALCVYVVCNMLSRMLKLTSYRVSIIPICYLIVPVSLMAYRNTAHYNNFASETWTLFCALHGFLIPLVLLIIAAWRGLRGEPVQESVPAQDQDIPGQPIMKSPSE